jgi:peptidoglycan hydrolase-like protein with peptidoglycan-binding domain
MRKSSAAALILFTFVLALAGRAAAAGDPEVAALQVGLRARGLYSGTVDGVLGPQTQAAVFTFQQRAGLEANGMPGPATRAALGRYGRTAPLGRRPLSRGARGWDVAALQFALAWHGFPSGPFDARLGTRTEAALRRFQAWAGLRPDGRAGPSTFAALRSPPPRSPVALSAPIQAPLGDGFGPRGNRFHAGLDFIAPAGSPVSAAGGGQVVFTGFQSGGWGKVIVVDHGGGVQTRYAHLSRIAVLLGQSVYRGQRIGLVGATGGATGPHLHFEVSVRGAAVDPRTAL